MALRVNQNIGALNVHRNLQATDNSVSKSIEKLSSGLRINRAADDPAGLALSEYLRTQVDGLGQALSNSSDAISMIKTAEGALTEVNALLRSMRDLAIHASNTGANNVEAAAADQAQIKSAVDSLERIATTTQWAGKLLLSGAAGVSGTSTNSLVTVEGGTAATKAGTYVVGVTTAATKASTTSTNRQVQQVTAGAVTGANGIGGADSGILRFSGAAVGASSIDIYVMAGDTIQDVIDRVNRHSELGQKVTASLNSAGTTMVFSSKFLNNTAASLNVQAVAGQGTSGTAANVTTFTGVSNAAVDSSISALANGAAKLSTAETLTLTDVANSNKSATVDLLVGDSLDTAVTKINTAALAGGIRLNASVDANSRIVFENTAYGNATYADVTITSNIGVAGSTANMGIGNATTIDLKGGGGAVGNFAAAVGGVNVAGTINGEAATGKGQLLIGGAGNANTEGLQVKVATGYTGNVANITVEQGSLVFQIGANHGQTVSQGLVSVSTYRLGTTATGLATGATSVADIDVTTLKGAQDAIKLLDAAISQVSMQRADLGAFQRNVLETNINSLGIAKENLAASESTIRDADMAAEMVNFTKQQIMMQAGTAMLAQANQLPQQLTQLLKG